MPAVDLASCDRATLMRTLLLVFLMDSFTIYLADVGGMPLVTVRAVLQAVEDPDLPMHEALGIAHRALGPDLGQEGDPAVAQARVDVDRFLDELGWNVSSSSPGRHELAVALATLRRLGWPNATPRLFERYAKAADRLARVEVPKTTPGATRAETMERVVIGTVVFGVVLSALRRLAQERHSALRFRSSRAASTSDRTARRGGA
jgi:hypothetical protein